MTPVQYYYRVSRDLLYAAMCGHDLEQHLARLQVAQAYASGWQVVPEGEMYVLCDPNGRTVARAGSAETAWAQLPPLVGIDG